MSESSKILAFWSGPRNISTALMYSFAQRLDTVVLDEPFFGHFLKYTKVWRPSREEVLLTMGTEIESILQHIEHTKSRDYTFLKNMSNHIEGFPIETILGYSNVILTRHPKKVLASYTKHIEKPKALDLGYEHQLKILKFLKEKKKPYLVVNSDEICIDPEIELKRICKFLQIPFDRSMLQWKAGPIKEDGVWAKYWYKNVHSSTGFKKPEEKEYPIADHLTDLYKESVNLYNDIINYK